MKKQHGGARQKAEGKRSKKINLLIRIDEQILGELKEYFPRYIMENGKWVVNPYCINRQVAVFLVKLNHAIKAEKINNLKNKS